MISILIIGNEILSAQVEETNLAHMLAAFKRSGHQVDEVRIVRDEVHLISEAIGDLSARSTYLISTGGVGPTHDDVTLKAYAEAFDSPLHYHPEMVQKIQDYFKGQAQESALRMANVPGNTELVYTGTSAWPIFKVANCFVLPGLPEVFVKKFEGVMSWLPAVADRYFAELFTSAMESEFAHMLAEEQRNHDQVEIGSYPTYNHPDYAAHVTLKGTNHQLINDLYQRLLAWFQEHGSLVAANQPVKSNQ